MVFCKMTQYIQTEKFLAFFICLFAENQILMNENAACISVQAFLKMCGLNVKVCENVF